MKARGQFWQGRKRVDDDKGGMASGGKGALCSGIRRSLLLSLLKSRKYKLRRIFIRQLSTHVDKNQELTLLLTPELSRRENLLEFFNALISPNASMTVLGDIVILLM